MKDCCDCCKVGLPCKSEVVQPVARIITMNRKISAERIVKIALTCDEARKAEHPMTRCMEEQGKKFDDPAAFCQDFLSRTCDYPPSKRSSVDVDLDNVIGLSKYS